MFKKVHADVKKSTLKLQDSKKDSSTRFKHLRIILDNIEGEEAKTFFEVNYSHIYYVFYDNFIYAETNLRPKVHKAHREELEAVLSVLDKLLTVIPELISRRWQCHSLSRIISKLLHPGNSFKLRKEAIKFFILWYQILGDNSSDEVHALFATLVPGFQSPFPEYPGLSTLNASSTFTVFHDAHHGPVCAIELQPVYPPQSGEKQPDDSVRFFMDALLEYMVSQICRIEWKDKGYKQHRCFTFLFDRFKQYYLQHIFPDFSFETDLYKPNLKIPTLRGKQCSDGKKDLEQFLNCRVAVIKWVANFTHLTKTPKAHSVGRSVSVTPSESEGERSPASELRRVSVGQTVSYQYDTTAMSVFTSQHDSHSNEDTNLNAFQVVRDVLYYSRDNVNFIHEIYRQAFLLNFTHSPAIRRAISVYKDWIQMNVTELPPFMLEPLEAHRGSGPSSSEFASIESSDDSIRQTRLRNDSYLGAIHKENLMIRAGLQNVLQVFITDASNVFLLDVGSEIPTLLDDQVDICKRVLNIYRYMVMHTHMDAKTWEQLLVVLLHITSLILSTSPPKKKEETLGGRLAPAIFQTLIVTWIKANLNVVIPSNLWDQFLVVLSSLTQWEELIREWAKTLETLTRVLARHVYGLDLTDLPLDRLSEQKAKRQRKGVGGSKSDRCDLIQHQESENPKPSSSTTDCGSNTEKESSAFQSLRRSVSETNLWNRHRIARHHSTSPANITALPAGVDIEIARLVSETCAPQKLKLDRKWRSLDSIKGSKGHFGSSYYDSECATRSPSPAPSSGVESNSFKESPIQIDVLSNEGASLDSQDGKSVMGGGSVRGWLPDVASVLWLRMLGALGDINKIQDPNLHAQVFHFLIDLFETLAKIRLNQGIPGDNQSTPPPPELVPPLTIFSSWCFQALSLPEAYKKGKLCAYRLLCNMTVMVHDVPLHSKHLSLFFSTLHLGLTSSDQNVVNTLIKHCGPRFLSLQLPGFTILLLDFVHASSSILSSNEIRATPRTEAISILGGMLSFPPSLTTLPVLQPGNADFLAKSCPDFRDHVLSIVLKCGKKEVAGIARCIALSSLGIFLYQELCKGRKHPKVKEAVNTLLLALRFNHKTVAQTASEILLLLCDHADTLMRFYPEIAPRILEVLVGTLSHLMPVGDSDKRLLTSLVFCLGEWTMHIPIKRLIHQHNGTCLLNNVFKVLDDLCEGGKGHGVQVGSFHPDLVQEFNPNLLLDDLKQDTSSGKRTIFPPSSASPAHLNSTAHSIQLAAKLVMSHLVNNLGHFPLTSGGANLGSLVVEQDDVVGLPSDQLSSQLFSAPNIQVFVTNQQQVMSFVEVPSLDVPGGGVGDGLVTAPSQVRVILRDLAGKASWDASILYCSQDNSLKNGTQIIEEQDLGLTAERSMLNSFYLSSISQHTLIDTHRPPHILPTYANSTEDMDNLDDLLQYIGHTSPEVLESLDTPRNVPAASFNGDLEQEAMSSILGMRIKHQDYVGKNSSSSIGGMYKELDSSKNEISPFQYCRLLFSQFGLHGWDLRSQLFLVDKNDKLLRELRNLDTQRCRQTHKVAVIYVAHGQEDKNSILSNSGGSQAYEEFIAGLAWEVELETHTGFMGGLQRNKMTGVTAPYYATSFTEAIFHVSTRMPSNNAEALLQKTRHLGNDEVHIVWSEHTRDYRRGIIPTEFCDVLIVIYPLPHYLYRIQVSRKPDVPYFGPLFNEAVVGHKELPGLVRATALSASRAKRSMLPFYQQYYEERAWSLETVMRNYKRGTTFEEFAANVFSPIQSSTSDTSVPSRSSGTSLHSIDEGSTSSAGSNSSSTLAMLESTVNKSHITHITGTDDSAAWIGGQESDICASHHGISPRPIKRIVLKPVYRKNPPPPLTPPDSPTSRRSK